MSAAVTLFRALLLASVMTGFAGGLLDLAFPSLVPESLSKAYEALPATASFALFGASALFLVTFGGTIASVVGLYYFQPWSRQLALVMTLLGLLFHPLLGPALSSGWAALLLEVSRTLWGAVLALSYVSSLSERFQPQISRRP